VTKQRTLDLRWKNLESRFTLGSEAHGIAENRQEGTKDLALKKDLFVDIPLEKSKHKTKNKRKKKRKKKKWLEYCALRNPGRTLSASINKTKTSKKNKAEIVIQLKTKEKKRNDDNRC
jgi:hypothetical protein